MAGVLHEIHLLKDLIILIFAIKAIFWMINFQQKSLLEDAEARTTKEAIEFFKRLGNRYNVSHVTQVKLPLYPQLVAKVSGPLSIC